MSLSFSFGQVSNFFLKKLEASLNYWNLDVALCTLKYRYASVYRLQFIAKLDYTLMLVPEKEICV